jgi:hypothetical protein
MHESRSSLRLHATVHLVLLLCTSELASAETVSESGHVRRTRLSIDVTKLRLAAHSLLVNGSELTAACVPTVETMDRPLTVAFDLPEISLPADTPSPFNQTCGRSWRCGCMRYEVCPGMQLTTAMTRDFQSVDDIRNVPPSLTVRLSALARP